MPYPRGGQPANHTEYGGGEGMIDPVARADRAMDDPAANQQDGASRLWEVYATNPAARGPEDPNFDPLTAEIGRDRRLETDKPTS